MNPFLVILILIGAVILWVALRSLFRPIGKMVCDILKDIKHQ